MLYIERTNDHIERTNELHLRRLRQNCLLQKILFNIKLKNTAVYSHNPYTNKNTHTVNTPMHTHARPRYNK
jgi:hypothetical protein